MSDPRDEAYTEACEEIAALKDLLRRRDARIRELEDALRRIVLSRDYQNRLTWRGEL